MDTYLGYAEEGYGLEMSFDRAYLNYDNWLILTFHVENKRADIFLCEDWDGLEKTDRELDKTAFHEVCEVLLLRIRYLAGKREFSYDELDGEIHSIIRILTAKIFEKS